MVKPKNKITSDSSEKSIENFKNIKKTVNGLMDIVKFTTSSEEDIYLKLAQDNVIILYQNLLELILNNNGLKELRKKLISSEIQVDIPIDIKNKK